MIAHRRLPALLCTFMKSSVLIQSERVQRIADGDEQLLPSIEQALTNFSGLLSRLWARI
jgi:hypothetical protein